MKNQTPLFQQGGHLKKIKKNKMPLDTKQQPPYYTPATTQNGTTTTNVATQTTTIQTTDTTAIPAAIYTMPANTMTENGNILILKYFGNTYNSPTQGDVSIKIFGNYYTFTVLGNNAWTIEAIIIRATSNTAYYKAELNYESAPQGQVQQGSIGSINWATPIDMQLNIQAPIDGNIRCTAGFTQLIK